MKTVSEVMDVLKDTTAGAWSVRVIYRQPLELTVKGQKAGHSQLDSYRITEATCRVKIKYSHMKSTKDAWASGARKRTYALPKGFKLAEKDEEKGIIYYAINTNVPALRLYSTPVRSKNKYYLDGQEITEQDIVNLYKNKVFKVSALPHERNEVFQLYLWKIIDILDLKNVSDNPEDAGQDEAVIVVDDEIESNVDEPIDDFAKDNLDNEEI